MKNVNELEAAVEIAKGREVAVAIARGAEVASEGAAGFYIFLKIRVILNCLYYVYIIQTNHQII